MRTTITLAVGILLSSSVAAAEAPSVSTLLDIRIETVDAPRALNEFIELTQLQVVFPSVDTRPLLVNPVSGLMTPTEALDRMFYGTRLRYDVIDPTVITITVKPEDAWESDSAYACTPLRWIAGMVFNRLGRMYVDLGLMPENEKLCVPNQIEGAAPVHALTLREMPPDDQAEVTVRTGSSRRPWWGPRH